MRFYRALGTVLICMGALALTAGPAAAAAPAWVIQPTAVPVAPQGVFSAVSCSSATACTAVGYAVNSTGATVTLAERWNGSTWAVAPTPSPTGASVSRLNGVSCSSATACTAVGYYVSSGGANQSLIESWNGTTWTPQTAVTPTGTTSSMLNAVRCSTATACTAVGEYVDFFGTQKLLAIGRAGSGWSVHTAPSPSGATSSQFNAVSCTSGTACTAVGGSAGPSGGLTLAERWDGSVWTLQSTLDPAGASSSVLNGVACSGATACSAVGSAINNVGLRLSLAETWNGSAWTLISTPNPAGATNTSLRDVSCASASACTAVGSSSAGGAAASPLAEGWNGTAWTIQATPVVPGATTGGLHDVSCTAATACTTVGFDGAGTSLTLAERWNGTTWTVQSSPSPSGATTSALHAVSCPTATSCTGVGYYFNSTGVGVTLAEIWNGTSWSIKATPNPAGAKRSTFNSVACASATTCIGSGYTVSSAGPELTLAEIWNGTAWTVQSTPNPAGARNSLLAAVSCPSSTTCISIGNYVSSADVKMTLGEAWTATGGWKLQSTPNPASAAGSVLRGLSCAATTACTAVGSYVNSGVTQTLAERWNGTAWAIQLPLNVPGASNNSLTSVSCASATACMATGHYVSSSGTTLPLAERWNGTAWTMTAIPAPSGASSSQLNGVSCTAAAACTAAGSATDSTGTGVGLTEAWNGTSWAIQAAPTPSGSTAAGLDGISCSAATTCTAGGFSVAASSMPLAIRN
jgi:hypothetical protein